MEKIIAAVIKAFPGMLAAWVYPWIAKPLLLPYVGGIPDPRFIGAKLVEAFTAPPASVDPLTVSDPIEAFVGTVVKVLEANGIVLTAQEVGPLMVRLGTRITADPDFPAPVVP